MATLTKANNADALNLASSWSPSQAPTASDALVFDSTFDVTTFQTINNTASVVGASLAIGLNPLTMWSLTLQSTASRTLLYPWSLDSLDSSESFAGTGQLFGLTIRGGISAPSSNLSVIQRLTNPQTRTTTMEFADSNVDITFPLVNDSVQKTAGLQVIAPASSISTTNYISVPTNTDSVCTVAALDDATITMAGYAESVIRQTTKVVVTGHPTKATAITIEAPTGSGGNLVRAQGSATAAGIFAMTPTSDGKMLIGGTASFELGGTTNGLVVFDPTSNDMTAVAKGIIGTATAIASDNSGNWWFGSNSQPNGIGISAGTGHNNGFANFRDGVWIDRGSGVNATVYGVSVAPDGKVYIAGTFTATNSAPIVVLPGVAVFDPATNTYASLGGVGLTSPTSASVVVASNGDVFVSSDVQVAGTGARMARWSPSTSTWTAVPSITDPVSRMSYDAGNNRIFVCMSSTTPYAIVDVAAFTTTFLPAAPGGAGIGAVYSSADNKLYAMGGSSPWFIVYDFATSSWATWGGISTSARGQTIALDSAGQVWVSGGTASLTLTGANQVNTTFLARYNPSAASWSIPTPNPYLLPNAATTAVMLYAGTTVAGVEVARAGGGTTTYIVPPNQDVSLVQQASSAASPVIRVRRGGALL